MIDATSARPVGPASGVFGVFFVLLGAGLVLDGDWLWRGTAVMSIGACLLATSRARSNRGVS